MHSGLLFYRAQSLSTEIEEILALAHIWGWTRFQSTYPLDISTASLPQCCLTVPLLVTSPVLSPNSHLPSASLTYPALFAALPWHLQSQLTLMHCSEQRPRYRGKERCLWCAIHCLVALLICCQFSFLRLLFLRTRSVLFVPACCHHIEDTDVSL